VRSGKPWSATWDRRPEDSLAAETETAKTTLKRWPSGAHGAVCAAAGRTQGPRFHFSSGSVRGSEPNIRVRADGYVPLILSNTPPDRAIPRAFALPTIRSRLDGCVVRLDPAVRTDPAYWAAIGRLVSSMEFAYRGLDCEWREVPRMLVMLHTAGGELAGTDAEQQVLLRPIDHVVVREHCGDPVEFFRGYLA